MIEINLLPEELKAKPKTKKVGTGVGGVGIEKKYFLYLIPFVLGLLVCVHIYLFVVNIAKNNQLRILNDKWQSLEPQRKILEKFDKEYMVFSQDAKAIKELSEQRINWSEKLNKLSLDLPSGIWFNEISLTNKDFTLQGLALSLQKEEMGLIKKFIDDLKDDTAFFRGFTNLELSTVQRKTIGSYDIVDFILIGTLSSR